MAARVFISYRRDDIAGQAGRVSDRLAQEFGHDSLFMDVDAIPLGVNFAKVLDEEVAKCDVLLAIIGPDWLGDKDGHRRLDNPHDYVRIEVAAALKRDIPVIPLLIDGAQIPKADQLPDNLKDLALRNGLNVRHASFHNDIDKLIQFLKERFGRSGAPPSQPRGPSRTKGRPWLIGTGAVSVAAVVALAWAVQSQLYTLSKQPAVVAQAPNATEPSPASRPSASASQSGALAPQPPPQAPADSQAARPNKLAADQGDAQTQYNLAVNYRDGLGGLPKDDREAARLLKLAADQGYASAQFSLGAFYVSGRGGLPKDDREAARLFKLAADQGYAKAQNSLGVYYQDGRGGLPKNDQEAVRLYKLAADQGEAVGQVTLGLMYENGGGGLPKDDQQAMRLYKLAADQGNANGQNNLGVFYRDGRAGLPKCPS
jgi:hypothetical protein